MTGDPFPDKRSRYKRGGGLNVPVTGVLPLCNVSTRALGPDPVQWTTVETPQMTGLVNVSDQSPLTFCDIIMGV